MNIGVLIVDKVGGNKSLIEDFINQLSYTKHHFINLNNSIGFFKNSKISDFEKFDLGYKKITNGTIDKLIVFYKDSFLPTIYFSKYKDIIVAPVLDELSSNLTMKHNNTNVLVLGYSQSISWNQLINIAKSFLESQYEGGRHQERIHLITKSFKEEN